MYIFTKKKLSRKFSRKAIHETNLYEETSVNFLPYLLLKFVPIFIAVFINFLPYLSPKFRGNDKNP